MEIRISDYNPFVIFAIDAASNGKPADAVALGVRQFKEWCSTAHYGVKELLGSWQGESEVSFIMSEADFKAGKVGDRWASHQQAYLISLSHIGPDRKRHVRLFYPKTGDLVDAGTWDCISGEKARTLAGWTFDPASGLFWAASLTPLLEVAAQVPLAA